MADVRLVIVGHVGFGVDHTPKGTARHLGGSGYACARGASVADASRVGLVARVGRDFDRSKLRRLGVDVRGVETVDGDSARFEIFQNPDNTRSVTSTLGVADHPDTWALPPGYEQARHVHLATMPLEQQRAWLEAARSLPSRPHVSVDMFESHAVDDPAAARELCRAADLVFMNAEESRILFSGRPLTSATVVKYGEHGAVYRSGRQAFRSDAPQVDAVDTTGAGEILAGALLSLLLAGCPQQTALRYATAVASAKVAEFGVDGERLTSALRHVQLTMADSPPRSSHLSAPGVRHDA